MTEFESIQRGGIEVGDGSLYLVLIDELI